MKDKKILFLILFALLLLFLILHLSRLVNLESARLKKTAAPLYSNTVRLESQVNQLQDLLRGFVQLNLTMKNNLETEKKQNTELKALMDEISRQKESLAGKLSQAEVSLELTGGIRKRLSEMEQSLSALKLAPDEEKEFKNQLWELSRGLDKVNYQIPGLIRENKNYKREAEDLKEALDKKNKELSSLKAGSDELSQTTRRLSQEIKSLKDANTSLKAKGADMEKLQNGLKQTNSGLNNELSRIRKDLEDSREKLSRAIKEAEILQKQKESYIARIRGLEASEAEITPLKKQLEELKQEMSALTRELEAVKAGALNAQKLQEELSKLQAQLGQLHNDYESLKGAAQAGEETLKQNALELGKRSDRIVTLADQMSALEAKSN